MDIEEMLRLLSSSADSSPTHQQQQSSNNSRLVVAESLLLRRKEDPLALSKLLFYPFSSLYTILSIVAWEEEACFPILIASRLV